MQIFVKEKTAQYRPTPTKIGMNSIHAGSGSFVWQNVYSENLAQKLFVDFVVQSAATTCKQKILSISKISQAAWLCTSTAKAYPNHNNFTNQGRPGRFRSSICCPTLALPINKTPESRICIRLKVEKSLGPHL